jgi:hypothetical protein
MIDRIRIIKHEVVPDCGSFEVVISGKKSRYFYWEDLPSRRLNPATSDRETALDEQRQQQGPLRVTCVRARRVAASHQNESTAGAEPPKVF